MTISNDGYPTASQLAFETIHIWGLPRPIANVVADNVDVPEGQIEVNSATQV